MDGRSEILPGARRGGIAAVALCSFLPTRPDPGAPGPLSLLPLTAPGRAEQSPRAAEPASWASVSATPPQPYPTGMWACLDIPLWAPSYPLPDASG